MPSARETVRLTLAVAVLLLAACTGDEPDTTPADPSPSQFSAPSSSPAVGSTDSPEDACENGPIPDNATITEAVEGDFDDDGVVDRFELWVLDDVLMARFDNSGPVDAEAEIVGGIPLDAIRPEVAQFFAGEGTFVFAVVGSGASAELFSIIGNRDCEVVQPTKLGDPNVWPVGLSAGSASGLECVFGPTGVVEILEHTLASDDGRRYEGTSTAYRLVDGAFVPGEVVPASYDAGSGREQLVSFDCGGFGR